MSNKLLKYTFIFWFLVAIIFWLSSNFDNNIFNMLKIVFGGIFIMIFPGLYIINTSFKKNEIELIEKIGLSFILSISIIPLLSFYGNIISIPINIWTVFALATTVILVCTIIMGLNKNERKRRRV